VSTVFFTEEATVCLDDLILILLKKAYFSYKKTADEYMDDLVDFVVSKIATSVKRVAPPRFKKFGQNLQYIKYKRNQQTTWYIFFIQNDNRILVTYITNNHVAAQHVKGL
jgi:hypothetical protein